MVGLGIRATARCSGVELAITIHTTISIKISPSCSSSAKGNSASNSALGTNRDRTISGYSLYRIRQNRHFVYLLDLREGCLPSSWGKRTPVPFPLSTPYFTHEIGCGGLEEVRQREARAQPPPALDPCPKAEA